MELFKNTNFDFLGKKWPFIIASLVLTAAGLVSLAMHGGPNYGIDFKGGALLYLRFNQEPPVQKIRAALESKVTGEVSVQQITGQPEVLVGTEIRNEKELNANRQIIEDTLRATFGAADGKLDLNNSAAGQLADKLREPLLQAGVALSEQELQDVVKNIEAFRASKGGTPEFVRPAFGRAGRYAADSGGRSSSSARWVRSRFCRPKWWGRRSARICSGRRFWRRCTRWAECWCISLSASNGFTAWRR